MFATYHALDRLLREGLSDLVLANGHWGGTGDVRPKGRWADASASEALDPAVLAEKHAVHLLAKELNHVLAIP